MTSTYTASEANLVDLYNVSYSSHAERVYREIRSETYGEDLGQTGWMTAEELESFFDRLQLTGSSKLLEVGCGAGGCALYLAHQTGATVTGIDINENGIETANALAVRKGLAGRVRFCRIDAGVRLPFEDESFDAVFSNDAMCHIPHRLQVLQEWRRVLKPGGRALFTDAMVVTGIVSNRELAVRTSIGNYYLVAPGVNEPLFCSAGLDLVATEDLTCCAEKISKRWRDARARRSGELIQLEGETNFIGLQDFLACVHTLSRERRLSRFLYVGAKQ